MLLHQNSFSDLEAKPKQYTFQPQQKGRVGERHLAGQIDFAGCARLVGHSAATGWPGG